MGYYNLSADEIEVFSEEANELIESLDNDLILVEHGADEEVINRVFRAMHTLKGAAGSVEHVGMAALTHAAETVLDRIRHKDLEISPELISVLLQVVDRLRIFVDDVVSDRAGDSDISQEMHLLNSFLEEDQFSNRNAPGVLPSLDRFALQQIQEGLDAGLSVLFVEAQADPQSVAPLARLLQLYIEMEEIGTVVYSEPSLDDLEHGRGSHQMISIVLTSSRENELEEELKQIPELESINVVEIADEVDLYIKHSRYDEKNDKKQDHKKPTQPVGVTGDPKSAEKQRDHLLDGVKSNVPRTVRTNIARLDNLMDLAGELVTNRNRLLEIIAEMSRFIGDEHIGALNDTVAHLSTITDNLHDEVMQARMQPIGYVFNKLPRLVRQISQELGKEVEIVLDGLDTELDRSVIEQINDPILHLIRNAIDHGIESPDERQRVGKARAGKLLLGARSEEGNIVITVEDDGRGIDTERVVRKALELGLLTPAEVDDLSHQDAINLIFAPGLSTVSEISTLSGRGVGMDVVRNNLQRLNGSVVVRSKSGAGTVFELRVPLTLAIIPALIVSIDGRVFAFPLHYVTDIFKLDPLMVKRANSQEVIDLQGSILPVLELQAVFASHGMSAVAGRNDWDRRNRETVLERDEERYIVAIHFGDNRVGLIVDQLLGKQDIVIKSLEYPLDNIRGLSGATLLGSGEIGLIIDVPVLIDVILEQKRSALRTSEPLSLQWANINGKYK
jgi:two-component system chemotaxis sensor kinase CheA